MRAPLVRTGLVASAVLLVFSGFCEPAGSLGNQIISLIGIQVNSIAFKIKDLPAVNHGADVWGLDFSPDGNRIAAGSGYQVDIWDWKTNRAETTLKLPQGANPLLVTNPLHFSPDGKLLAVSVSKALGNVTTRIWKTRDWTTAVDIVDAQIGIVSAAAFTPDGSYLVSAVNRIGEPTDNFIVRKTSGWEIEWSLKLNLFTPMSMSISPDGRWAACGGTLTEVPPAGITDIAERLRRTRERPQIQIVDMRQRKVATTLNGSAVGPVTWSPDGHRIAVAGLGYVEFFDSRSGSPLLHEPAEGTTHINVEFSPDGRFFLDSDMNGKGTGRGLQIWDQARHKMLQHIQGNIKSIAMSPDSRYLAAGGTGGTTLWQIQ